MRHTMNKSLQKNNNDIDVIIIIKISLLHKKQLYIEWIAEYLSTKRTHIKSRCLF